MHSNLNPPSTTSEHTFLNSSGYVLIQSKASHLNPSRKYSPNRLGLVTPTNAWPFFDLSSRPTLTEGEPKVNNSQKKNNNKIERQPLPISGIEQAAH